MTFWDYLWENTVLLSALCLAAVYVLGFLSGRAKWRVDRKRDQDRESA